MNMDVEISDYILKDKSVRSAFGVLASKENAYLEYFVLTEKELEIARSFKLPTYWAQQHTNYIKTI